MSNTSEINHVISEIIRMSMCVMRVQHFMCVDNVVYPSVGQVNRLNSGINTRDNKIRWFRTHYYPLLPNIEAGSSHSIRIHWSRALQFAIYGESCPMARSTKQINFDLNRMFLLKREKSMLSNYIQRVTAINFESFVWVFTLSSRILSPFFVFGRVSTAASVVFYRCRGPNAWKCVANTTN